MRATSVIAFAVSLFLASVIVDPSIVHTLSAHPFEAGAVTCMLGAAVTVEPLAVKPKVAWAMLSISHAFGYELLNRGELESYMDGRTRKITMASIKAYIERRLEAERKESARPARTERATAGRMAKYHARQATGVEPPRRGRPGKRAASPIVAASPRLGDQHAIEPAE